MEFTDSGARGGYLGAGIPPEAAAHANSLDSAVELESPMSFFSYDSPDNARPDSSGPVLLMPPPHKPTRRQLWTQRIWLVVFVLFCLEIGIILTVLPWTRVWTDNSLLLGYPRVREFAALGFVRGLVSGLGLVDIWLGVSEAVRYREAGDA